MVHKITVIAEIGVNHNGNMDLAKSMITIAKKIGANVAKFQLYSVDKLFPNKQIISQNKNWFNEILKTELTYEQTAWLAAYCKTVGIEFMASCYDLERLAWLEEIGVKRHKIANRYKWSHLLNAMKETGKQIIISTYPGDPFVEWEFWCGTCREARDYKFLYCISDYPTKLEDLHFSKIEFRDGHFDGFSDHTVGVETSMIAMSRGAKIIEKHFTLNKNDQSGPDHICSAEPNELKQLVEFARIVEEVL